MMDVDVEILQKLHHDHRDPDPAHIAQLPKPTKKANHKGHCDHCGGWHGLPAVHLDYMGHAEVTDVLLDADPTWTWEPFAITEAGLPRVTEIDDDLVLWIKLTIGGVTRPGVGTAPKFKGGDALKELIGDAIRNAGMRFGIALTLWSKADGVEREAEQAQENAAPEPIGDRDRQEIEALISALHDDEKAVLRDEWKKRRVPKLEALTVDDIDAVHDLIAEVERLVTDAEAEAPNQ